MIDFFRLALYRKRLVCQGVPSKNAENPSCRSWQGVFCFLPLTHGCVSDGFIGAERKRQTEHRFPKREFYRTVFGFVWLIFDKLWFILYFIRVTHLPYWAPPAVCYEQRWRISLLFGIGINHISVGNTPTQKRKAGDTMKRPMTPQAEKELASIVWLNCINKYLFSHHKISEVEFRRMCEKIAVWKLHPTGKSDN